jgi:hypothetical protein
MQIILFLGETEQCSTAPLPLLEWDPDKLIHLNVQVSFRPFLCLLAIDCHGMRCHGS